MRSPRICRRALLTGHLKANPKSKDAGRKCAEESAAFKGKARSAAKPAARPRTNRGDRASACDEVACVKTALGFNKKKPHPTAFRDAIREDSRHTIPSRGVRREKSSPSRRTWKSRAKRQDDVRALPEAYGASRLAPRTALVPASDQQSTTTA